MFKLKSIVLLIALAISNFANADITSGLVAYYPFNGNANDASGNANNGTVNGATLTADRFGNVNSAYLFNELGDKIVITDTFNTLAPPSLTVSVWVMIYGNNYGWGGSGMVIYKGKYDPFPNMAYSIELRNDFSCIGFRSDTAVRRGSNTGVECLLPQDGIIQTNKWYHLASTFDNELKLAKFYINGNLRGQIAFTGTINQTSEYLCIGAYCYNDGYHFNGIIDDIRIYNRGLTESEIQSLYREGTPPSVATNAPSVITSTTARLQGTVNPNLAPTTVTFACNGLTSVNANPNLIAAIAGATEVYANLNGLTCNTQYTCRCVAVNSAGTTNGNNQVFTTSNAICTPLAVTKPATAITATSAVLNATVTPNGMNTAVIFELGTTTNYGAGVLANVETINATDSATLIRGNATGLTCNTTYNYRIKAINSLGTSYGANASFKTAICPTPADLIITSIKSNPTMPVVDSIFSATVTIKNQGGALTKGVFVDVWENQIATQTCNSAGDDWAYINQLAAGASTTVTVSNLIAGTAGVKLLRAFVDGDCVINETNETNNQSTALYYVNQPTSPLDLLITGITLNPIAPLKNGTFNATITIKNAGTAASDGKLLDVWSNQSYNSLCGAVGNKRVTVGTIAIGATKTVTVTGLVAGSTTGNKILRTFVDSGCSIAERLENNNQFTKAYSVQ